jgi:hypothetical protein
MRKIASARRRGRPRISFDWAPFVFGGWPAGDGTASDERVIDTFALSGSSIPHPYF